MIAGAPVRSGATSPSRTAVTTTIEKTTRTDSQKVPPPVAKKPEHDSPTKKVITEELRYTTVPPAQQTVIEEMRYTTPPAKRTVIEEEYRSVACLGARDQAVGSRDKSYLICRTSEEGFRAAQISDPDLLRSAEYRVRSGYEIRSLNHSPNVSPVSLLFSLSLFNRIRYNTIYKMLSSSSYFPLAL